MNVVAATATQRALVVNQRVPTCFEYGRQGHYMSECHKLKSQTHGNKAGKKTKEARGKAYVLGGGEANPDSNRFQELTMMCTKMVPKEEDRVKKFIGGLSDNIQGNVIAAKPTRLQDVVCIANNLMDQKLKGYVVKNAESKRRFDSNLKDNRVQQSSYKRQNVGGQSVARAYTASNNEKKGYDGPLPYCNKCKLHHKGPCIVKCEKCNK
nr:hypothetical protein [Tanacetum cinerariifolium]